VTARAYEVNGASEVEAWSLAKVYPG
jgi:hypothetical protein